MSRFAIPKLIYSFWILELNIENLKQLDKESRNIMIQKGALAPGSCLPLLYLDRKEGGRGLKSVEDVYYECKIKIGLYLLNCKDIIIKQVVELEKGRKKLSILEKITVYAAKIGVEIRKNEEKCKYGVIGKNEEIITNQRR